MIRWLRRSETVGALRRHVLLLAGMLVIGGSSPSAAEETVNPASSAKVPPAPQLGTLDSKLEFPQPLLGADGARPIEEDLQALKEQRFQELRRQLDELSQLLPSSSSPELATPTLEMERSPLSDGSMRVPPPYNGAPAANTLPAKSDPGAASVTEEEEFHDRPESTPSIISSMAPDSSAKPVEGPVDRFSLAVSLFGSRQWDVCLSVLEQLDTKELPTEDRVFSEYLKGCCHRHCGRLDEAQRSYRRILGEKDAGWVADLARWWLDNLEEKRRLQNDVQRLADTLKAWETEIAVLAQHPD